MLGRHWPLPGRELSLNQYARLLTGLMWFAWADWMTAGGDRGVIPLLAVTVGAGSLVVIALAVLVAGEGRSGRFDRLLLAGSVAIIALVGVASATTHSLGTDEIALNQGAANQLLHGANPYTADLSAALHQFGTSIGTLTLHGTTVSTVSYPALSFLLYLPAMALFGGGSYASLLVDLACWSLAALILWRVSTPRVRAWVPLFFALPLFFGPVTGGNVDTLSLPFLLIALFAWDRYGDPTETSLARWIGPVALGIACAIKQNPWLVAPFLVAGVAMEARARGQDWRRVAGRYAAVTCGVFLLFNLPFVVWDPAAWLGRVLQPVTGDLVPGGMGPVDLIRAYGLGGGNLVLFSAASLAALLAAFALYLWRYPLLKALVPALPLAALFVSSRSLTTYFAFTVPAVAVAAASARKTPEATLLPVALRAAKWTGFAAAAACAACLVAALSVPPPLRLAVVSVQSRSGVIHLQVRVDNRSTADVTPHFIYAQGRDFRIALAVRGGPATLPPSTGATYALDASVPTSLTAGSAFEVQAVSAAPASMAVSAEGSLPASTGG